MNTSNVPSLRAGEDIGVSVRVRLNSSGLLVACSAALTAECIGHTAYGLTAYQQPGRDCAAVHAKACGQLMDAIAAGAIAAGGEFKANDDGKIVACVTGLAEGRLPAGEAAAGAGSIVQVIYYAAPITRS